MNKNIFILAFIIASRFFGLFIVLPFLSSWAGILEGFNDLLAGFIVGAYAIFQMILSAPFGALSDKIGRKKTMFLGLIIFIIGSLICANATHIYTMLLGRILQGSGAIGGVGSAMISDFTDEKNRTKAMAIVGMCIGCSFALSIIVGSILVKFFGLSSLFYISAILSVFCIFGLFLLPKENLAKSIYKKATKRDIFTKNITILYFTSMLQKLIISSSFFIIAIKFAFWWDKSEIYKLYIPCMILGFFAMGFGGGFGEKRGLAKHILIVGGVLFAFENILLCFGDFLFFVVGVVVFFIAFCLHEPIMQSYVSKVCKAEQKGVVLGTFNAFGYFGSFLGASLAGFFLHSGLLNTFFIGISIVCICWVILLYFLDNANDFDLIILENNLDLSNLKGLNGILDCYFNRQKTIIKYNKKIILKEEILKRINIV